MCWPLLTDTNLCNCINLQLQLHLPLSLSQGGSSFSVNKIMDCMTFSCIYNYSLYRQLESHTNKHNNNLMACMKTGCYKPLVPCWLVTQTQRHTHTQPPPFVTIADKLLSAIQKQLHTHTFTHTYTTNSKGRDLFFLLVTREHVWCKIKWVRSAWSVTGGFSIFCLHVLEKNEEKEGICKRQVEGFFSFAHTLTSVDLISLKR